MKKILGIAASLVLVIVSANAQSEKKEPPPPPKPKDEVVKFTPPKIVKDEEVPVKAPPPSPPKIIIDEKFPVKEPPVITVKGKMTDNFNERNPSVVEISREGNIITLKKKDGTKEKYDMSKKEDEKSFTEKYGVSPIPPPPPLKKVS